MVAGKLLPLRQSYNLDGLVDYGCDSVPETTMVVNPAYRTLDGQVRKTVNRLSRKIAAFGAINLNGEIEPRNVEAFAQRKADLQDNIAQLQTEAAEFKAKRKATNKHITYAELPEAAQFDRLSTQSKHLVDTVKMIAYRAGNSHGADCPPEDEASPSDARSLLRAIYSTEADILPDPQAKTLTIAPYANQSSDNAIRHLCDQLNETETLFPGTELRLKYELVSDQTH